MADFSGNIDLVALAQKGDKAALAELTAKNGGLVRSIASRFTGRGVEQEDLMQIGYLGMLKAVKSFDPSFGTAFSTYAVPLILGEIKRYLRDDGMIKISRSAKQCAYLLLREKERFESEHGREPRISELCSITGISVDNAIYALEAGSPVLSLQESVGDSDDGALLGDMIGENPMERTVEKIALYEAVERLPDQQRALILLRYFRGLSQVQAARLLGITQVKVSREEHRIFEKLRSAL